MAAGTACQGIVKNIHIKPTIKAKYWLNAVAKPAPTLAQPHLEIIK